MEIDIITIFPEIAEGPLESSIMKRAQESGSVSIRCHDLRDFTTDRHRQVDDEPYGGGPGMVMKPEPFFAAVESLRNEHSRVILMSPGGRPFRQDLAEELSQCEHLIFLCGHYEGIDQRVTDALVDDEISIGDYVLTNGTIAAAVVTDAVVRLIPGVLGDDTSAIEESFSGADGYLEAPQYTRPSAFRGLKVPDILLSGHHGKIEEWRRERSIEKTRRVRPDLLE